MKKGFKIIQLNGISGLIMAILTVGAILFSIIVFPVYGIKFLWNTFISESFEIQTIRLAQAALLWGAVLAVVFGYLRSKIQFKLVNASTFPQDRLMNKVDYEKFIEQIKKEEENNDEKINR